MAFPAFVAKTALESPEFEQNIASGVIRQTQLVHPAWKARHLISLSSYISNFAPGPLTAYFISSTIYFIFSCPSSLKRRKSSSTNVSSRALA